MKLNAVSVSQGVLHASIRHHARGEEIMRWCTKVRLVADDTELSDTSENLYVRDKNGEFHPKEDELTTYKRVLQFLKDLR